MPLRNSFPSLFLMMLFAALGCGGSGITPRKSAPVGPLTISPSQSASVTFGGSVQFQAYEGTIQDTNVKWSVSPGISAGSINQSGLYVAPNSSTGVPSSVTVAASDQGGAGTASVTFSITGNPIPNISFVTPNTLTPGMTASITLNGSGLSKVTVVDIGGEPVASQVISDSQIAFTYIVPAWQSGTISITATSPSPGGGTSAPLLLPVIQPAISYDAAARFLQQAAWAPTDSNT